MTNRHLFICLGLAFGVVYAFNIVLAYKIDSVPKLIIREMEAKSRIDALFLGNSLMASGLDTACFESAWPSSSRRPQAFNAGLGSSSPVEHYLLAHQTYLHHQTIPYVVYGFFDFQLTQPPDFKWEDLEGNRSMGYSTEPGTAASLYRPESRLEKWRFFLIGAVPMLREHSQLWKFVETFRRVLGGIGMPQEKTNQFGRVADFQFMAEPHQPEFNRACEEAVNNSAPFIPAVRALLQLTRDRNSQLIVVEMPMNLAHRQLGYATPAWQRYRTYLQKRLQAEGVLYVTASDWVPDDADFSDGLHLDKKGARVFSAKLAALIAALNISQRLAMNPEPAHT